MLIARANLTYVPSVINWIGIDVYRVQGQFPIASLMLDGKAGFVWVSLNYSSPISTDVPPPLVKMSFHVEAYGISPLNLTGTQLLESTGNPIAHSDSDGFFSNIIIDVAVTNVVPATNYIFQGLSDDTNVTVANLGNVSETFNVTAYADNITIGMFPVINLASNAQITLTFVWNTTSYASCQNYTISGVASLVPHEYNRRNNVLIDGTVKVRLYGDVNDDGKVDGKDTALASLAFGTVPGDPRWNPNADINQNGKIDGIDIVLIELNFGKSCP